MPYHYLDTLATADVAFEAWGRTLEEMFTAAADATMNVMVASLETITDCARRPITLQNEDIELLLFQFLQEFLYYKDAEPLLLRTQRIEITTVKDIFHLHATVAGEPPVPDKHDLVVDVKAVTMHQFSVTKTNDRWLARVILDI